MFYARSWILIAFILGVLPIGLSSTEMWDGVVSVQSVGSGDWQVLKGIALDSNWYLTYGLFLLADALQKFTDLPYWVSFKVLSVSLIAGISYEVYRLARQIFGIPAAIAAWLPALVFSFPIWYIFFTYTSVSGHLACVWLGLAGYRLVYSDKKSQILLGVVFVTLSFQLASNCAFILALECGRWALSKNKSLWSYGRSIGIFLLALAAFAATRIIWPPVGTYVGYNRFLNPLYLTSWISYIKYSALFSTWLVLLIPTLLGIWWSRVRSDTDQSIVACGLWQALNHQRIVLGVFALLMLSACAPYIAVGLGSPLFTVNAGTSGSVSAVLASNAAWGYLGIWFGGWGARHMLLMMIPMVLFAGWLTSFAHQKVIPSDEDKLRTSSACINTTFTTTIIVFLIVGLSGHWAKLQRIAKEQAVVQLLAGKPQLPYGQVDLLLDKHEDFLSSIYETNYLLYRAYANTHWAALMLPDNPVVRAWGDQHRRLTLDVAPKDHSKIAGLNMMTNYSWSDTCKTIARVKLPSLGIWDVLWRAEHMPAQLPAARIEPVSTNCLNTNPFWQSR